MRGGVTLSELLDRYSQADRDIMYKVVNANIENTKAAKMPLL